MSVASDIIERIDEQSGVLVTYRITDTWYDGSPMTDAKADGFVYRKKASSYYKRSFDDITNQFLIKENIQDLRDITSTEVLLLKIGVYKGVEVQGYYEKGDTPAAIIYYISESGVDDSGSYISTPNGDFITSDIESNPYVEYFGAKKNESGYDNSEVINKVYDKYKSIKFDVGTYYISSPIYINDKPKSVITGGGRKTSIIKANDDFRVVTSGDSTDGRFDFENSMIIARRGVKTDLPSITIDPLDNLTIKGILLDGSSVAPVGLELWMMFSEINDVEVTGTIEDAVVLRRGWNNSFDNLYCYYNTGNGFVLESECNSTRLGKIVIAHCDKTGFRLCQGHSVNISSISVESSNEDGMHIEAVRFIELESQGSTQNAISAVTINSAYLENNCETTDYANIKLIGGQAVDAVDIKSVYINMGNGRPLFLQGKLRRYVNIEYIGIYSLSNKSFIGFLNNQLEGDVCNITFNGMTEDMFDFYDNYESTQIAFLRNSKSGSKSFNGINLRRNLGNQRAIGDVEYRESDKILAFYTENQINTNNGVRINAYNEFTQIISGVNFTFIISNKIVHIVVKGTVSSSFTGDVILTTPNYLNSLANKYGTEILHSDANTDIQTRDYSALYVRLTSGVALDLKLMYILI